MKRVAILGATGYTALELIKLLLRHPEVEITCVTSRQQEQPELAAVHPGLAARIELRCQPFVPDQVAEMADCVFSTLPHTASMEACAQLLQRGCHVIDFSADYRLRDPNTYADWYGASHSDVEHLDEAVYGLPEVYGHDLAGARLVANPGCYPTAAILGLAPLVSGDLIELDGIVIDAKSGVSGAGRSPKPNLHFPECNECTSAYSVGRHRHTPEIEQVLSDLAGESVRVAFVPHLVPMDRGILATIYARPKRRHSETELQEIYSGYFQDARFVRVRGQPPRTKDTTGSNFYDVSVQTVGDYIVVLGCLDNLIKGAAGTAVQNFNLMFGFPETTALL